MVQADAKIVSQIFHAHGFHEVRNKDTPLPSCGLFGKQFKLSPPGWGGEEFTYLKKLIKNFVKL